MVGTVANNSNAGTWVSNVQLNDAAGAENIGCNINTSQVQTYSVGVPARAKAGKPLVFSVEAQGDTNGAKYNVWVVVEQLM